MAKEQAMPHILLTGAGFSRNWGGWLASEVFEHLLGRGKQRNCVGSARKHIMSRGQGRIQQAVLGLIKGNEYDAWSLAEKAAGQNRDRHWIDTILRLNV